MLLVRHFMVFKWEVCLLNCYVMYIRRKSFSYLVVNYGILKALNLIVVGDLNLTLSIAEIWGETAGSDPLVDYFLKLLEDNSLLDITPTILRLT